jgi:glycosyltransferase involved in cell wall biosynthesis
VRDFVSCVLATKDRPAFVAQALRCWERQTHSDRELIVVDDGAPGPVAALCDGRAGVRYLHLEPTLLGTKLNIGIDAAEGDVLQKWDDDDWYAPDFLETALGALRTQPPGRGFVLWEDHLVFLAWNGELHYSGRGHKAGPSLCFDRDLWAAGPFRDLPQWVDSYFIGDHPDYLPVSGPEQLMLVRHKANTWREFWGINVDEHMEREWEPWPRPMSAFMDEEDVAFYEKLAAQVQKLSAAQSDVAEEGA